MADMPTHPVSGAVPNCKDCAWGTPKQVPTELRARIECHALPKTPIMLMAVNPTTKVQQPATLYVHPLMGPEEACSLFYPKEVAPATPAGQNSPPKP